MTWQECCRGLPEQLQAQSEAAEEEEETGPPLGTKRQYLVVMRHGERMDEIDVSWRETSKRPWDPPLSNKGLQQVLNGTCCKINIELHGIGSPRCTECLYEAWLRSSVTLCLRIAGKCSSRETEGIQVWQSLHFPLPEVRS